MPRDRQLPATEGTSIGGWSDARSWTAGDPAEQIVQPGTERHEFLAEPVNRNVGVIQFLGGLLAGREKKGSVLEQVCCRGCRLLPRR
jgi:hypothetical protein